jgi:hypothetical protein
MHESRLNGEWSVAIPLMSITPKGAYVAETTYLESDYVSYLGSSWLSLANDNLGHTPSEGAYWTLIAAKGTTGDEGTAATLTIGTTTTLNPGDPVTATNSGTTTAAVLNLGIPKGYDGADGANFTVSAMGLYAGRSTYDTEAADFSYLVVDDSSEFDRMIFFKLSATSGDWSTGKPWTGAAGASINPRGAWDVGATYSKRDLVSYTNGNSYVSRTDANIANLPTDTTNWLVSAEKGETGATPTGAELLTNKATSFSTVNDTLYPTVRAVNDQITQAVVGLWDDRGNYNASGNTFPATGGSGTAGAIMKSDIWTISVAGTLGGAAVDTGDQVRALSDAPGQTAGNWAITQANITYTPENAANKETSALDTSTTKYPCNNVVKTAIDLKAPLASPIFTGSITTPIIKPAADSTTAVKVTKADGSTAAFTIDTTNGRIGAGSSAPAYTFDAGTSGSMRGAAFYCSDDVYMSTSSNMLRLYGKYGMKFTTYTGGAAADNMQLSPAGNLGLGIASASITARLHLAAGTATAGTAPLKIDVGTALGTAEPGVLNHVGNTTNSSFTVTPYVSGVATVKTIAYTDTGMNAISLQGRALANTAPTDGQAVIWDATGSTWKPGTVSGGSSTPLAWFSYASAPALSTHYAAIAVGDLWVNTVTNDIYRKDVDNATEDQFTKVYTGSTGGLSAPASNGKTYAIKDAGWVEISSADATSYGNPGGCGSRNSFVTATSNNWPTIVLGLIDGSAGTNAGELLNFSTDGSYFRFQFESAVIINEIKWYQTSPDDSHGTWKVQGSNDGTSWTDVGSTFTLGGTTLQTITTVSANTTRYSYYQLMGISGTTSSFGYVKEIEFKISR